jgi:hypothetical protein
MRFPWATTQCISITELCSARHKERSFGSDLNNISKQLQSLIGLGVKAIVHKNTTLKTNNCIIHLCAHYSG